MPESNVFKNTHELLTRLKEPGGHRFNPQQRRSKWYVHHTFRVQCDQNGCSCS